MSGHFKLINFKMENLQHLVISNLRLEFDYNPETGETSNVKMRTVAPRVQKNPAQKPVKPVDLYQLCIAAELTPTSLKLTRAAAEYCGLIDKDGVFTMTSKGNRIKVKPGFTPYNSAMLPSLSIDDDESMVGSQQFRDNLSVSFSGSNNAMMSQIGRFFTFEKLDNSTFVMHPKKSKEEIIEEYRDGLQKETTSVGGVLNDVTNEPQNNAIEDRLTDTDGLDEDPLNLGNDIPDPTDPEISGITDEEYDDATSDEGDNVTYDDFDDQGI